MPLPYIVLHYPVVFLFLFLFFQLGKTETQQDLVTCPTSQASLEIQKVPLWTWLQSPHC